MKKLLLALALGCGPRQPTAHFDDSNVRFDDEERHPASELVRQGEEKLLAREWAEADALFVEALRENPSDPRAHLSRGLALEALENDAGAETEYRLALEHDADLVEAMVNLGALLLETDRHSEALPILQRARTLAPRNAAMLQTLAQCQALAGQTDEAVASFREATEVHPDDAFLRLAFGTLLMDTEHCTDAVTELARAIELTSEVDIRFASAQGLRRCGAHSQSVATLQAIVAEAETASPVVLRELARAQRDAGNLADAIQTGERALSLDPMSAENCALLAGLLAARRGPNDLSRARELLNTAIAHAPTPEVRQRLEHTRSQL